ncbi:hypothetical protein [Pontibacillus marinus]|uniref:Uncharacterized protein n=1 Tax=Pontibacillus marinus BH030004 = DSM 16465 TaxID=1385511 RepID=A0A0A5GIT0_9BACI|nr:hypothetical protein [Pontibacillus marinus]KGX91035.1 hypothetical protein N783_13435 [Pontibacillus marinus BH030004 = DSM 16465]
MTKAKSRTYALIMIFFLVISTFLPYVPVTNVQAATTDITITPTAGYTINSDNPGGMAITPLADQSKSDYIQLKQNSSGEFTFNLADLKFAVETGKDYLVESKLYVTNSDGQQKKLYDQKNFSGSTLLAKTNIDLSQLALQEYDITAAPQGFTFNRYYYAFNQNGIIASMDASTSNLVTTIQPAAVMYTAKDESGEKYNMIKYDPTTSIDFSEEISSVVKLSVPSDSTTDRGITQVNYEGVYSTGLLSATGVKSVYVSPSSDLTVFGNENGEPFIKGGLNVSSDYQLDFSSQDSTTDDTTDSTTTSTLDTIDGFNVVSFMHGNISNVSNGEAVYPDADVNKDLSLSESFTLEDTATYQLNLVYQLEKNGEVFLYVYTDTLTGSEFKALSSVSMDQAYNQLSINKPTGVSVDKYVHVPNVNQSNFTFFDPIGIEQILYDSDVSTPYVKLKGSNTNDELFHMVEQVDLSSTSSLDFSNTMTSLLTITIDDPAVTSIGAIDNVGDSFTYQTVLNQPMIKVTPGTYQMDVSKTTGDYRYTFHTSKQQISSDIKFQLADSMSSASVKMDLSSSSFFRVEHLLQYGDFYLNYIANSATNEHLKGSITIEDQAEAMTPVTDERTYLVNDYYNGDLQPGDYTYTFTYPLPGQTNPVTVTEPFTLGDTTSEPSMDLSVKLVDDTTVEFGGVGPANQEVMVSLLQNSVELQSQQINTDDVGFLQGSFDISSYNDGEYTLSLQDPSSGAETTASFTLDTSSDNTTQDPLALQNLNVQTGSNPYIEFTTGDQDYSTANQLHFQMSGNVLPGVIQDNVQNNFNKSVVSLNNIDDGATVNLDHVNSSIKNNSDSTDPNFLYTGLRLATGATLQANTTYQITFESEAGSSIFSNVLNNVYADAAAENTELSIWNQTTDQETEIAHQTIHVSNPDITSTSTPTLKQFGGSNEAVLVGNQVQMDLGSTDNMSNIETLKVVLESSEINLQDYGFTSTYNENEMTTTTNVSSQDLVNINITKDTAFNSASSVLTVQATNNDFTQVVDQIIKNPDANSFYVLGYNASNELVGYKKLETTRKEVVIDPAFEFNYSQKTPAIGRFESVDVDHTSSKSFPVEVINTGDMNKDHVIVEGKTTSARGETYPFLLTLTRGDQDGNFRGDFSIVGHYNERFKGVPSDFDKATYETTTLTDDNRYDELPVDPGVRNTITFNYSNSAGDTVSKTFDWYPADSPDIFKDGNIQETITPQSEQITVDLRRFNGSMDNAIVELYQLGSDGTKTKVAEFDQAINKQPKTVEDTDENGNVVWTGYYSQVTFTQSEAALNNLASLNSQELVANVKYKQEYTNDSNEIVSTVSFEEGVGSVNLVTEPLRPHVYNDGETVINDQTYYTFTVDFDRREVAEANFTSQNLAFYNYVGEALPLTESTDYLLRGNPERTSDKYHRYQLLVSKSAYQPGMQVEISGVTDTLGSTMKEPTREMLRMYTNVNSQLVDSEGNILSSKVLMAVRNNEIPDILNGEWDEVNRYHFEVDSLGKLSQQLEAGAYTVIGMKNIGEDQFTSKHFGFAIPVQSIDQVYQKDIVVPASNVTGNIKRSSDYELTETLAFMKQSYVDTYQSLLKQAKDSSLTKEQRDEIWGQIQTIEDLYLVTTVTDVNGHFDLYLEEGNYKLLGKQVGQDIVPPSAETTFTAPGATLNDVTIAEPSTFMVLKDFAGNPVSDAHVVISGPNGFQVAPVTNEEGKVGLYLPQEGTYNVRHVTVQNEKGSQLFPLKDSKPIEYLSTNTQLEVQLPEPNVDFEFTVNGSEVMSSDYASLTIEEVVDGSTVSSFGASSYNGEFSAYLPAGDYKVSHYQFDRMEQDVNQPFTVQADTPLTQAINIGENFNAYVELVDEQGNGLAGYHVEVGAEEQGWYESGTTNENGKLLVSVPQDIISENGTQITVEGYEYQNTWNRLENQTFMIDTSNSASDRAGTTIRLSAPNLNGYVIDPDTETRITDAWLQVRNKTTQQSYSYQISNEGEFHASIQEAGDYVIEGVGTREKWIEIQYPFTANTNTNGDIQLVNQDGNALPSPLELTEVQPNFFGHLYQKYDSTGQGVPYTGQYVEMILKEKGVKEANYQQYPWLYEENIQVNADGYFEANLDSTKEYEVIAIATDQEYYRFDSGITIPLSTTEAYEFTPQSTFTFSGEAYTYENAQSIIDGDMWLEKVTDNQENREGTSVRLHDGGVFGQNLQEGSTYIIRDMYYRTNEQEQHNRLEMNKEITIGQNTKGLKLQPNVKGVISLGELAAENQERMGALIRPVYTQEDFNDEAAYQQYKDNPWQYEVWTDMKLDAQDPTKANFYAFLEEGTYKLRGLDVNGSFVDVNQTFTINRDGSSDNVVMNEGEFQTKYQVTMDYTPNVTGSVQENGTAMKNAHVQVVKLTDEWTKDYDIQNYHVGVNTNQNGTFMLNLDDGNYRIEGYHTQGQWQGSQWVEGKFVPVRKEFTVSGQQVTSRSGEQRTNISLEPNIYGDIQMDAGTNSTKWFTIRECTDQTCEQFESGEPYWGNTASSSTEFAAMLKDGHYMVTEAGAHNDWIRTNTQFEVSDGQLVGSDRLQVTEEEPNFEGTAYLDSDQSTALEWGWINVRPADSSDQDWGSTFSINTNKHGEFSTKLKDGSWTIVSFGNQNTWKQVQIPFTVTNGTIESTGNGMTQQDGSISIYPPAPNVTGTVEDKQDNPLTTNAWIAIKPADAGTHDWDQVRWTQYKADAGSFEITLPTGKYKVVEVSSQNTWYKTNIPFEVLQGETTTLQVTPLEPTLEGTVYKDSTGTNLIQNGWVTVARFDEQGTQTKLDGSQITDSEEQKDPNTNVFWNHTESTEINEGQFDMVLQDGRYKVISVGGEDTWYLPNKEFTIQNGTMQQITVQKPADNVTVTLKNVPGKYQSEQPYLMVTRSIDGETYGVELKFESATDNSYTFKGTLQDGTYNIASFIGSSNLPIEEQIDLQGSGEFTIDLGGSASQNQMVTGEVLLGGEDVTTAFSLEVKDENDKTKVIHIEQNGTFSRPLRKGMTYTITGMMKQSGGYKTVNTEQTFTITEENEATIQLDIQPNK